MAGIYHLHGISVGGGEDLRRSEEREGEREHGREFEGENQQIEGGRCG